MIELRINGTRLAVPADVSINREFESTIFNREKEVTDFTLPLELPLTEDTIQALDYPNVLANPNIKQDYDCELITEGMFINKVTLRVLRTRLKEKTCSVSLIGNYGSFARIVGDKMVSQLQLGGVRTIGVPNSSYTGLRTMAAGTAIGAGSLNLEVYYKGSSAGLHMGNVKAGLVTTDYLFGTACDQKINLEYIHETLKTEEEVLSFINAFDTTTGTYPDPFRHYLNAALTLQGVSDAQWSSNRLFWIPEFRLVFVLRKCFEECGFTIEGDIFSDPDFAKIVLPNNYAINSYTTNVVVNPTTPSQGAIYIDCKSYTIDPRNHVPKWKVTDFVTEVAKNYNLQYLIDYSSMHVKVLRLNNVQQLPAFDLSNRADPYPEINFEKPEFAKGYEFSFDFDANDGASGENVEEDIGDYLMRGAVPDPAGLSSIPSPAAYDLAYVRTENAYYQYGGTEWFFYSHNLGKHRTSDESSLQKVSTKVVPMPQKPFTYSTQQGNAASFETRVLPYSAAGIEGKNLIGMIPQNYAALATPPATIEELADITFKKVTYTLPEPINPRVAIYTGTGTNYPTLSSVPFSAAGVPISGYGQAWNVPGGYGLVSAWWQAFVDTLANSIGVDYQVLLDAYTYNQLDFNQQILRIDGQNYLCRKAEVDLQFPAVGKLILVRI